jgi:hypothetical protein
MFSSGCFSASCERRLLRSSTDGLCCSHYLEKRHRILPNSLQWLPLPIIPRGDVGWSPISRLAAVATQGFGSTSNPNLVWYNFSSTMCWISSYELNKWTLSSQVACYPLLYSTLLFCFVDDQHCWWLFVVIDCLVMMMYVPCLCECYYIEVSHMVGREFF